MKAVALAVFPVELIVSVLQSRGKGVDHTLSERFGYSRAKRMSPSVRSVMKDFSFVHCGQYPLVSWVGYQYTARFNVGRGCYINTQGEHVYPA